MNLVNSLLRIWPYVWPHRRRLFLSCIFAGLVALLWGANLTIVFPVVNVLQGKSLPGYVQEEIEKTTAEVQAEEARVAKYQSQLDTIQTQGTLTQDQREEQVELLEKRTKHQTKLARAGRNLTLLKWLNTTIMPWVPRDRFNCFALILGVLLLATALKGTFIYIQDLMVGSVVELTMMDIRKACFRKTLKLDYQSLAREGTPSLMSKFTYDMSMMASGLSLLGGKVIREPLKAAACVIGAFMVNWQLTMLSLLFVPLAGFVFYRFGKMLKRASHRMMESMSRIYKTLEESFSAIKVVLAFGNERVHRKQFHSENKSYYRKAMKIVRIDSLTSPTTELLGLCAAYVAVLPCVYLLLRGTTSIWGITLASAPPDVATLALLYGLLAGVIDPVRKLSSVYAKLKRSTAAADRVFELMDRESAVKQATSPLVLPHHSKSVEFRNIYFSYSNDGDDRRDVLKDVSLTVNHGEVIVIVGENGSGKSTLVNFLPRFYDPDHGSILIDGIDLKKARLQDLRRQIGVVTQDTLLFDGTIFDNIRYGKRTATQAEIEDAATRAGVMQFIDQLPEGFETNIGEKGGCLSGGQRQRIALARAMVREPSILILDEATSAIDAQSEHLIHQGLRKFADGRTVFIITHSVSSSILDFVSRIVVMDQGRLIAAGTHDDVLRTCPVYEKLYRAQVHQRAA